ncbi:hypothetical protein KSF_084380 [Reticulibacter mediterranei]|uniref:Shedu protein SduA C-terminal domain-containing protein n=1 Tax=Reticulibacter mediterranei TaxID=2778369 RepID=A0A8J3ITR6_9CHLR|nr:Shedu anti-phage system protein SduA domain-containing protein [Reticulibacter mediterranei]GHO98390.1 hypothetical protein KSF_084380 [Reticulibacter mediterranei]
MDRMDHIKNAYQFFVNAEKNNRAFTAKEIVTVTGYSLNTVRAYIVKRWWWFLSTDQNLLRCQGLGGYPVEKFISDHTYKLTDSLTNIKEGTESTDRASAKSYALAELETMIKTGADEAAFQKHLKLNRWMFGSEYCELLDRRRWTRDEQQDFMLRRTTDRCLEVIEIKTTLADLPLFIKDGSHSTLYPRSEVSLALGQVIHYLTKLDANRLAILAEDKEDVSQIKAKIIIGRSIDAEQAQALHAFNSYLHRIQIMTFDQLILIAKQVLGGSI